MALNFCLFSCLSGVYRHSKRLKQMHTWDSRGYSGSYMLTISIYFGPSAYGILASEKNMVSQVLMALLTNAEEL